MEKPPGRARTASALPPYMCQRSKVGAKHFPSCGICSGMFGLETAPAGHSGKKKKKKGQFDYFSSAGFNGTYRICTILSLLLDASLLSASVSLKEKTGCSLWSAGSSLKTDQALE